MIEAALSIVGLLIWLYKRHLERQPERERQKDMEAIDEGLAGDDADAASARLSGLLDKTKDPGSPK